MPTGLPTSLMLSATLLTEKSSGEVQSASASEGPSRTAWHLRAGENHLASLHARHERRTTELSSVREQSHSSTFLTLIFLHRALGTFHGRKLGFIKTKTYFQLHLVFFRLHALSCFLLWFAYGVCPQAPAFDTWFSAAVFGGCETLGNKGPSRKTQTASRVGPEGSTPLLEPLSTSCSDT